MVVILKLVVILAVNVVSEFYQNAVKVLLGLLALPVSSLNNRQPSSPFSSPHLSSLNILARLWSSCQPVIVCHKTEPSLSPLTRARLQHRALTSKQGITSRKEVSVANQALI